MTSNERVRLIRKSLNLTMDKFGYRLGVGKTAISGIETGRNSLTDQMAKSICREFNVDYIWLTTGDGEMFIDNDDDFIERINFIMSDENDARKNLIMTLLHAPDSDIESLNSLIDYYISLRDFSKQKD